MGINATRLFSVLYGGSLSAGRVQSPTLAMLVKRAADIAAFVKTPFYTPIIDCGFTASGERTDDKAAAEAIATACNGQTAAVGSVERQKKSSAPPKLYDLTTLQREANRLYGYTAQQTLDCAQSLYEKKLLSYPRTDSRFLTSDMSATVHPLLTWLMSNMQYAKNSTYIPDIAWIIDDKKVSDHHAIIPTAEILRANVDALPRDARDILNLVCVRLMTATAPVHTYEAVTATLMCAGYTFTAKGKTVLDTGWKEIEDAFKRKTAAKDTESDDGEDEGEALPGLSQGQVFENTTASVREGTTTPPKHYTEDTLLAAMETAGAEDMPEDAERKGLGTPATRAAIIEKLVASGSVLRQKKNLIATDKGINLIAVLPPAIKSPKLTAEWEHKLKQVEHGELSDTTFLDEIAGFIRKIVAANTTPKPEFTGLFPAKNKNTSESLGKCPRCASDVREGDKGYFCDDRNCRFKMWKSDKWWENKKISLTPTRVTALLKDGRVAVKGIYSDKKDKKYDGVVILDDTGDKFVNFKLEFAKG